MEPHLLPHLQTWDRGRLQTSVNQPSPLSHWDKTNDIQTQGCWEEYIHQWAFMSGLKSSWPSPSSQICLQPISFPECISTYQCSLDRQRLVLFGDFPHTVPLTCKVLLPPLFSFKSSLQSKIQFLPEVLPPLPWSPVGLPSPSSHCAACTIPSGTYPETSLCCFT